MKIIIRNTYLLIFATISFSVLQTTNTAYAETDLNRIPPSQYVKVLRSPYLNQTYKIEQKLIPKNDLFIPLVADPRESKYSITYKYFNVRKGDNFNAGVVSFGDHFPIVNLVPNDRSLVQFGIDGSLFSTFDIDVESKDLLNSDFIFGLWAAYRQDALSTRLRLYHNSSHLGDEFVIKNPDRARENSSYEELEITASYEWMYARAYIGTGAIIRTKHSIKPWTIQTGLEFRLPIENASYEIIAASDIQVRERQHWGADQTYHIGLRWGKANERHIRIVSEIATGFFPDGQFFEERLSYFGLGIYFSP
jgi:hypothetical protein